MICPDCEKRGEKSRVYEEGTFATLMCIDTYYGEDGTRHVDDPNSYSTWFTCSRNHRFSRVRENGKAEIISSEMHQAKAGGFAKEQDDSLSFQGTTITDEHGAALVNGPQRGDGQ